MHSRKLPAMRVLTAAEVSATAADRFWKHYADRPDDWRFADNKSLGTMRAEISAAEKTPEALSKILNVAWLYPYCGACKQYANAVIHCDDGYGGDPINTCLTCAESFVSLLKQFPGAADKID